jgi:predicted transcriptional regulator
MSDKKATLRITVGPVPLAEMGQAFVDKWHRIEAGDRAAEYRLSFDSLETMTRTLSPRRLDLLRYVRRHPVTRITQLARDLRRDYKNVHADVTALTEAGLLEKTAEGFRAPFAYLHTEIAL